MVQLRSEREDHMDLERDSDPEPGASPAPGETESNNPTPDPPVSVVMRHAVVTLAPDQRLSRAADLFAREHLPTIPVIDSERHVIGTLRERDVRERGRSSRSDVSVADMMTTDLTLARDTDPVHDVADYLLDERFVAVPVVDADDRLVGSLSYVDILAWMVHAAGASDPWPTPRGRSA